MGACCSKDLNPVEDGKGMREYDEFEDEDDNVMNGDDGARVRVQGHSRLASMHTQQGRKGINQDAMTVWEDVIGEKGLLLCGVFDGHGPYGHKVARHVRDALPSKLSSKYKLFQHNGDNNSDVDVDDEDDNDNTSPDTEDTQEKDSPDHIDNQNPLITSWRTSFAESFKEMDEELERDPTVDCFCSGTTAVIVIKQGDHLIIANVGDSRAVLGTRGYNNQLVPDQLTNDLKPDLPGEKERIVNCKGRVFAMDGEPEYLQRLWAADGDWPGLAMSRAFGDFCLKMYGLISIPEMSYRKLTDKDEFVVLATDGVWDVLTNEEVLRIVASATKRSMAPKMIVDRAVQGWRLKYPGSKIDDCAVICMFLKAPKLLARSKSYVNRGNMSHSENAVYRSCIGRGCQGDHKSANGRMTSDPNDWSALEGDCRVNSILSLPRFARALSWRKTAKDFEGIVV